MDQHCFNKLSAFIITDESYYQIKMIIIIFEDAIGWKYAVSDLKTYFRIMWMVVCYLEDIFDTDWSIMTVVLL